MGLVNKSYGPDPQEKNIFYKTYEDVPGGLTISRAEFKADTKYALRGTPVEIDHVNRTATIVKTAVVYEDNAGTTDIKIVKNRHELKAGDIVGKDIGGTAYEISSIDTSNTDYDLITVSTALGNLTAGDVLIQSVASGATACAEARTAHGMLKATYNIEDDNVGVAVVLRAQVIEGNLPYALHSKNKESLTERFSFLG